MASVSYSTRRSSSSRLSGVDQRIGGAAVAVERHADRARVDELDVADRRRAAELDVGMAEHQPRVAGAGEQLLLLVGRLGAERAQVRDRRSVDEARAGHLGFDRQRAELVGGRVAERGAGVGDRRLQRAVCGRVAARPAVDVAADPGGGLELAQPRDGLGLPGAEERVVAAEQPLARAGRLRVLQHRVERAEVAMDVIEDGDHGMRV